MVVVGPPRNVLNNPLSILTWGGHLNDADQMAALGQTLGVPVTRAYSLSGIQAALNSAPQQGCTDILLFITGEGSPVPFQIPAGLQPLLGGTRYIGGNSTPNIELDPNGTRIFAPQLARALGTAYAGAPAGAKPSFSLVVQECFGGRLFTSLADAPGVTVIATSSPAGGEAARNAVGGASPWVDGMTDGIQTAEGPKGGIPWTPAVIQAFNGLPPTDDEPQMDVQGKIISKPTKSAPPPSPCQKPNHGGGIDVLLQGEFFGRQWASGEVTASSTDGSAEQTATVGYDYVSVGHFGPWQCGSTTTLRAIPAQGNHFDRWSSPQGLCATTASTCTVPITTTADQVTAFFAPTVYTLTVVNQQPDGRVTGQDGSGGYLNPGIDCGSDPNGPTIQVWTDCTSGAIAQRSETDVTDLRVAADNPGPLQHAYGIASINGCDNSIAATVPVPGNQGGTYVPYLDCFINMTGDRTITVNYKDVG
jgi:hypothetical protein